MTETVSSSCSENWTTTKCGLPARHSKKPCSTSRLIGAATSRLSHVHAEWPAAAVEGDNLISSQSELSVGLAVIVGEFHLVHILISDLNYHPHLAGSPP